MGLDDKGLEKIVSLFKKYVRERQYYHGKERVSDLGDYCICVGDVLHPVSDFGVAGPIIEIRFIFDKGKFRLKIPYTLSNPDGNLWRGELIRGTRMYEELKIIAEKLGKLENSLDDAEIYTINPEIYQKK